MPPPPSAPVRITNKGLTSSREFSCLSSGPTLFHWKHRWDSAPLCRGGVARCKACTPATLCCRHDIIRRRGVESEACYSLDCALCTGSSATVWCRCRHAERRRHSYLPRGLPNFSYMVEYSTIGSGLHIVVIQIEFIFDYSVTHMWARNIARAQEHCGTPSRHAQTSICSLVKILVRSNHSAQVGMVRHHPPPF